MDLNIRGMDERLVAELRVRAAKEGRTLKAVIILALEAIVGWAPAVPGISQADDSLVEQTYERNRERTAALHPAEKERNGLRGHHFGVAGGKKLTAEQFLALKPSERLRAQREGKA